MSDAIKRNLAKQIAALELELDAVTDQITTAIDSVTKAKLQARIDKIVEELNCKYAQSKGGRTNPLHRDRDWKANLHLIDYREIEKLAQKIKNEFLTQSVRKGADRNG